MLLEKIQRKIIQMNRPEKPMKLKSSSGVYAAWLQYYDDAEKYMDNLEKKFNKGKQMATKIIPAKKEVTCDICKRNCEGIRRQDGHIDIHRHALDYQGMPCADGSLKIDLCDNCLGDVCKAINKLEVERKKKK